MSNTLEIIAQDNNKCGEGPIWDAAHRRLLWTDIVSSLTYQYLPATGKKSIMSQGLMVAGIALTATDELVFAGSGGLHLWRGPGNCRTLATEYAGESFYFNDIIADPRGRVYAGTVYWGDNGMEKPGKLYLFEKGGRCRIVEEGIELSNGLGFSPDERTLYYTDTTARRIYAYDWQPATGDLTNRRVFVQVPTDEGGPDGMTVDAEGFVWSAQWYGSQVVRYDPDGKVERRIPMPVTQVSAVAFGGDDLTDLYITTAADSWSSPYAPPGYDFNAPNIGGSLYRLRGDVQGKREYLADL